MKRAIRFRAGQTPGEVPGEWARLKVTQGQDKGAIFVLTQASAIIGRGEESDIVLLDLRTSRKHAEIQFKKNCWSIKDLGSSNGIEFQNKKFREIEIKSGETFSIGETSFQFFMSQAPAIALAALQTATPIQAPPQQSSGEGLQDPIFGGLSQGGKGATAGGDSKRTLFLMGGVGLVFIYLFVLDGGEKNSDKKAPSAKSSPSASSSEGADQAKVVWDDQSLASYLPQGEDSKALETIFKEGMREYYVGNYRRAKVQFDTVLQVNPGHILARIYLENCNQSLDSLVKSHLADGKKSMQFGKLLNSKGHFEAILRILNRDTNNSAYKEAKDQLEILVKKLAGHNS